MSGDRCGVGGSSLVTVELLDAPQVAVVRSTTLLVLDEATPLLSPRLSPLLFLRLSPLLLSSPLPSPPPRLSPRLPPRPSCDRPSPLPQADVLLSLGFAPQLSSILGQLRPDRRTPSPSPLLSATAATPLGAAPAPSSRRQTLLFSATLPPALEEAAAGWATFASQTQGASPRPPSP